jgi:DNA polymerase I-like protein with 3'-5' exonuclease and polymerase domains
MRTSYNIAGTRTGRLSSSFSEFGASGTNFQNIEERLREIFVADPGHKLA